MRPWPCFISSEMTKHADNHPKDGMAPWIKHVFHLNMCCLSCISILHYIYIYICNIIYIYIYILYIYTRDYQSVSCPCPNYCHDAGRHWRCKCSLQCLSASHLQPIPGIYTSRIIPTKTDNHAQEKCLRCHMRAVLIKLTCLNALLTSVEIPLRRTPYVILTKAPN